MSDTKTPEQLRADYEAIKATNPLLAARFAMVHRVHEPVTTAPVARAFPSGDHNARLAQLRPSGLAGSAVDFSTLAPEDPRVVHAEMKKTNPVLAARYAIEHRIFDGK